MNNYKVPKGWLSEGYKFKNGTHYVRLINRKADLSVLATGETMFEAFGKAVDTAMLAVVK